jgi:GT2 family glycosyltransferase
MTISVVIPTCDRIDNLRRCLKALGNVPDEIVVSDDGCTADSVSEDFPSVRFVGGPKRGPAANRNSAARCVRGVWIVFLDDDCVPDRNFVVAYRDAISRHPYAVLEGRTSALGARTRLDMECPANETGGYLWSCNMAIRRDLFDRLGGFDEAFIGASMEDVDLRERLRKQGVPIVFVPAARVWHGWRIRRNRQAYERDAINTAYFLRKHPDHAPEFRHKALLLNLARRVLSHTPRAAFRIRSVRGLWRELVLAVEEYRALAKHCAPSMPRMFRRCLETRDGNTTDCGSAE